MRKEILVIWIFPLISCAVISVIISIAKFNRPVTGLTIGLTIGFILGLLTKLIYDDCYKFDKLKGFRRFDNSTVESFDDFIKVPYYFFYIWFTPLFMYFARYLKYLVIFWSIVIIIYLIVHSIMKGL
jgi:hypothetical protein